MKTFWTVLFSTLTLIIFSQIKFNDNSGSLPEKGGDPEESFWVDSVFSTLNEEERIAQLFMVPAYSNRSLKDNKEVTDQILKYDIGGIIFFQGGPQEQARMTNFWQGMAKTPLMIAIDGEWGLGMRLKDSTISYPKQMTLGAIQNDSLIYEMGYDIARQFKRMGIHLNFAPVVDVNSNPRNPVINYRSFGEIRENVARKGIAYMKGMQDHGVLASAKHFPGHGDTDMDSHVSLPVINHSYSLLDSLDLYPFKKLIGNGVASVLVAHLNVPSVDSSQVPSTLSYDVITCLLRERLGFNGLIITDALGMEGVKGANKPGEIEVKALQAGNDILLMSGDVPTAIAAIKLAVVSGRLSQQEIDRKCRNILTYKYRTGLYKKQRVELQGLYRDLNDPKSEFLLRRLYESSVTLVKNEGNLLPFKNIDTMNIACISVGDDGKKTDFQSMVEQYSHVDFFNLPKDFIDSNFVKLDSLLRPYNIVIIGLHSSSTLPSSNYGINNQMIRLVNEISAEKKVVLDLFASPYALASINGTCDIPAIIVSYQNNKYTREAGAAAIFGGIGVSGKLPVTASVDYPVNTGFNTDPMRLKYAVPEEAWIESRMLGKVDSIVLQGINDSVYPGCQVFISVGNHVIYNKSFGYHTYSKTKKVVNSDVYDLASVTKVAATTLAVMKLFEEGKIDLDEKLGTYLPELENSNKANLLIRDVMTHQARLLAYIPFYKALVINGKYDLSVFSKEKTAQFPIRVADSIYIRWDYPEVMFNEIIKSPLHENKKYLYSDLGFYLMKRVVEKISGEPIDTYVTKNFYKPLGLSTMCYKPRESVDLSRIVPSENDTSFRHQVLVGDVNDPGAAMSGGVEGHAGLFSNANDLGILFQMLINKGKYGGFCCFDEKTVNEFTRYQFKNNRRGLGFDKPIPDGKGGPCCDEASEESFGHSGFTGTFVWADPKYKIVYVFLSNRTYPYSSLNKLVESGIRTKIQEVIYKAVLSSYQ